MAIIDNKINTINGIPLLINGKPLHTKTGTLQTGLLSYYKMNSITSNVVIDELNNANLTNVGGTLTTGKIGNSIDLTTNTDKLTGLNTAFNFERTNSFSVSFWYNGTPPASGGMVISKLGLISYCGYYIYIDNSAGYTIGIYLLASASSLQKRCRAITNGLFSNWVHFVVTYDGSSNANGIDFYVNSSKNPFTIITDANNLNSSILNTDIFQIGNWIQGNNSVGAKLDEFGIWNKVLTQTEVNTLYNNGNGNSY